MHADHADNLFCLIEEVCGEILCDQKIYVNDPYVCVRQNRLDDLKVIIDSGFDVNTRDISMGTGRTILQEAAANGHVQCIDLILYYEKTDINAVTYLGKDTALHLAVRNNHRDAAFTLLHQGADPNQSNKYGSRPLHYAFRKSIASLLINFGGLTSIRNDNGQTPVDVAASGNNGGRNDLLIFLRQADEMSTKMEIRCEINDIRKQKEECALKEKKQKETLEKELQQDVMGKYLAWRLR